MKVLDKMEKISGTLIFFSGVMFGGLVGAAVVCELAKRLNMTSGNLLKW